MLTELEKKVIAALQGDIPIIAQPYVQIARRLDIAEETLLEIIAGLHKRGIMRRFGATLRHQKSGFDANAMTAWQVEEARIEEVGRIMAGFKQVTHCYRRDPTAQWPYNLYTMIHAGSEEACRRIAREMAEKSGIAVYKLLFSRRELKKTSMQYFAEMAATAVETQ